MGNKIIWCAGAVQRWLIDLGLGTEKPFAWLELES